VYPNPQDALPVPPHPSIEQYKKLAKDLVKACKSGNPAAIRAWAAGWIEKLIALHWKQDTPPDRAEIDRRIEQVEQFARAKLVGTDPSHPKCSLADAQFVIARALGFESWPKFAKHVETRVRESVVSAFEAAADAIVDGDAPTLRRLLRDAPSLIGARSTREHNSTLLHYVSANGVESYRQKTPKNIVDIAKILLDAGAEVDAESDVYGGGATTLGLVATSAHPKGAGLQIPLIDLLLEHGAQTNRPGGGNDHNLITACLRNGCPEAATHLVERGAIPDLEGAAGVGRLDLVKAFFDVGPHAQAKPSRKDIAHAFGEACAHGHRDVAEFLLDNGMPIDGRSNLIGNGHTGLHAAAIGGHMDVVDLLLRRGAQVNELDDSWGTPPLAWALWGWHNNSDAASKHYRDVILALAAAGSFVRPDWLDFDYVRNDPELLAALRAASTRARS
jgi:ankyrin repeat protein